LVLEIGARDIQDTGPLVCRHSPNLHCCLVGFQVIALWDASRDPNPLEGHTNVGIISNFVSDVKKLHISICIVSSGTSVNRTPTFIFALGTAMP